tara:strand:+ start:650 stop:967 length:318 start_codon:yes stop_codon:yes gene_type:complete
MGALAGICSVIGMIIFLVGSIMILIAAFRKSVLWGLGSLFIPGVALVFLIMHWQDAKKPFLISLLAIPLFILAAVFGALGGGGSATVEVGDDAIDSTSEVVGDQQ